MVSAPSSTTTPPKTLEQILNDRDANPPITDAAFEAYMWEQVPWVVCAKAGNCTGTIPKAAWLADRGGTCKNAVTLALEKDPGSLAVELDLCNLNSQMDNLCSELLRSIQGVSVANCLAIGGTTCLDKAFFYTPSTYSASNQQVSHLDVLFDPSGCAVRAPHPSPTVAREGILCPALLLLLDLGHIEDNNWTSPRAYYPAPHASKCWCWHLIGRPQTCSNAPPLLCKPPPAPNCPQSKPHP